MWPIIPWRTTVSLFALILGLTIAAVTWIEPRWKKSPWFRVAFAMFGGVAALAMMMWAGGRVTHRWGSIHESAGVAYALVIVGLPAALLMPFGAGMARMGRAKDGAKTGVTRRALLRYGGGALPAVAAATAGTGLKMTPARVKHVPMAYADLHPDLEGLKILQLSDLHLGVELGLPDLERGLATAMREAKPDLIVITGDLADDTTLIEPALEMIAKAGARYGAYACLGNHEYHRASESLPHFKRSRVPLLVGEGRQIKVGDAVLHIGGADDPRHMSGPLAKMLEPTIRSSIHNAPPADLKVLMCHRPEGLKPASELGYDLVLAGHTHGGQIGLFGKSLLEKVMPGGMWWGSYEKGRTRLYTTSGFGHWFPFRFGCPTEMPIITLQSSGRNGSKKSLRAGSEGLPTRPRQRSHGA